MLQMVYNCLIVGNKGVGKTTFIHRHVTGDFQSTYVPTEHLMVNTINIQTPRDTVDFRIYDGGYPANIDCAIIMIMVDHNSINNIMHYYNWITAHFGNVPISICCNKADLPKSKGFNEKLEHMLNTTHAHLYLNYFEVSAKSNFNYEKPFLFLAETLDRLDRRQ